MGRKRAKWQMLEAPDVPRTRLLPVYWRMVMAGICRPPREHADTDWRVG